MSQHFYFLKILKNFSAETYELVEILSESIFNFEVTSEKYNLFFKCQVNLVKDIHV